MTEHTPTPWRWDGMEPADTFDLSRLDERDANSAHTTLEGPERSVLIPWDYEGYSCGVYIRAEDAAFIIKAVNNYEALVDALEQIAAPFDWTLAQTVGRLEDLREIAAKALKAVSNE